MPHHQPRPPHPRASPFRTPGAVVKTHNSSVGSVSGRWVGRNWGLPTALPTHDFQMFASSSVSTVVTAVRVRTVCRSGCVLFIKLFKSLRSWSRCSSCCFEVFKRSLSFRITVPCLLTSCWSSFFDTKGTAQFSLVAVAISSDLRAARPILIGTSALIHRLGSLSCAPPPFYRLALQFQGPPRCFLAAPTARESVARRVQLASGGSKPAGPSGACGDSTCQSIA